MTQTRRDHACFDASRNAAIAHDATLETTIPVPCNVQLVIKAATEEELFSPATVGNDRVMHISFLHTMDER